MDAKNCGKLKTGSKLIIKEVDKHLTIVHWRIICTRYSSCIFKL